MKWWKNKYIITEKEIAEQLEKFEYATIPEYIKQYEELKKNKYIIEAINPDFFFEIVDYLLKENARLKNKLLDITKGKKVIEEETLQYIKENYIPKDKIEEILNETEITDFNSLVEAFLEIKKLLESE